MRKSVSAFVFGLIGSIFSLWWGFTFGLIGDVGSSIIGGLGGSSGTLNTMQILGWLCFVGAIIGIIGASLCFKKARTGGIVLAFSTLACGSLLLYLFINAVKGGAMVPTLILIFLLPVIFMLVATVSAFIAKSVQNYANQTVQIPVQATPFGQPRQQSLEQELTELKNMFDKNLISEEEYNQAKKGIIDKHTK